jgi:hypothetical protein
MFTVSYLINEHEHHVCYCTGWIIVHERLFQSIKPDSTKESLDKFAQTVTSSFRENYHQKWVDAVKKQSWWMMSKQLTAEKLRDLVMEHRMVSSCVDGTNSALLIVSASVINLRYFEAAVSWM